MHCGYIYIYISWCTRATPDDTHLHDEVDDRDDDREDDLDLRVEEDERRRLEQPHRELDDAM